MDKHVVGWGETLAPINVKSQVCDGKQLFWCLAWVPETLAGQWGFLGKPWGQQQQPGKIQKAMPDGQNSPHERWLLIGEDDLMVDAVEEIKEG